MSYTRLPRPQRSLTVVAPTICELLGVPPPPVAADRPLAPLVEGWGRVERLLVLLIDALGVSTWLASRLQMPFLSAVFEQNLVPLESVVPTKTPVCFATIASGALPPLHQVRARQDEFAVPTIFHSFAAARVSNVVVGRAQSSTGLLYARYAGAARLSRANRDDRVVALLAQVLRERPRFVFCQLLDLDNAGHAAGPSSARSREAAGRCDRRAASICHAAADRGYRLLFLADHGQHDVPQPDGTVRGDHDGSSPADLVVPCSWWPPAD